MIHHPFRLSKQIREKVESESVALNLLSLATSTIHIFPALKPLHYNDCLLVHEKYYTFTCNPKLFLESFLNYFFNILLVAALCGNPV